MSAPRPSAAAGATSLAATLYKEHQALVYRLALRYGRGDAGWAEDRTHEVFITAMAHAEHIAAMDTPEAWFYRVTTNRCVSRLRWEKVRNFEPLQWLLGRGHAAPDPEHAGLVQEELRRVAAIVAKAAPKAQASFYMYHVDGMTQEQIGKVLGHSTGYVCKLIDKVTRAIAADREKTP